jgi:hypothetical protein
MTCVSDELSVHLLGCTFPLLASAEIGRLSSEEEAASEQAELLKAGRAARLLSSPESSSSAGAPPPHATIMLHERNQGLPDRRVGGTSPLDPPPPIGVVETGA